MFQMILCLFVGLMSSLLIFMRYMIRMYFSLQELLIFKPYADIGDGDVESFIP